MPETSRFLVRIVLRMRISRIAGQTDMIAKSQEAIGKRILVVEDEWFIAQDLVRDLRTLSIEVVGPASSVSEALELVAVERLSGAVLDINLRGEMVFPVADALAARGVPFVFATGYDAEAIPERHRAAARHDTLADVRMLTAALFPA